MGIQAIKRGMLAAALFAGVMGVTAAATTTSAQARYCRGIATGKWVNINPATRGVTKLILARSCNSRRMYVVKMWGKCHPRDCSWRPARAAYFGHGRFRSFINHGFARRRVSMIYRHGRLYVRVLTDFVDPNRRDYVKVYRFRRI